MLAKRIIPCLDGTGGASSRASTLSNCAMQATRGGAARYNAPGADELTFLDITATSDGRDLVTTSSGRGQPGLHPADRGGAACSHVDVCAA